MQPEAVSQPRWAKPLCRDFASVVDHHVLAEVLTIAASTQVISSQKLMSPDDGLGARLRKLIKIRQATQTSATGLMTLLTRFRWLQKAQTGEGHCITDEGRRVLALNKVAPDRFRIGVTEALHKYYTIPGWFIERLFALNPKGEGQIVLPAPRRRFKATKAMQSDCDWTSYLSDETAASIVEVNNRLPGSFPVDNKSWLDSVEREWNMLSAETNADGTLRKRRGTQKDKHTAKYGVRGRLLHAMREAAIKLLFSERWADLQPDFAFAPLSYRASQVWCPRLGELELIFYTDYHPDVSGRLIVPCANFRPSTTLRSIEDRFLPIGIRNPNGIHLALHHPQWASFRSMFAKDLFEVYRINSLRAKIRYISLLAVRDEVCRRLRISANRFDIFLEALYTENARGALPDIGIDSISVESDLRLDQRSDVGLNQRPVYVNRIPRSLIAIKSL
ncbi:MAG: hypothetical protein IPK22_19260 [Verrucomicrobiaceae bacterium]|nr:hypothetical protein [Verrucomicrobiaceae bacterium]